MLVIARKEGQRVYLNDEIVVQVLEIRGNVVRLGFEAPAEVPIVREELVPDEKRCFGAAGNRQRTGRAGKESSNHGTFSKH